MLASGSKELICPLTGFVFSPAGWHATLLISHVADGGVGLDAGSSSMRQVVLGYMLPAAGAIIPDLNP